MSGVRIAPSVLAADLLRIAEQVEAVTLAGADCIHIDVMDGRFVPNITFGANMVSAIRRVTTLPLDVHLMIAEPEKHVRAFADAGANWLTFHPEATIHVQRQLAAIRDLGMRAGLALNPGTPLGLAEEVIEDLDLLLVMTVNPGFGGQHYIPAATGKIRRARALLAEHESQAYLAVDGGISRHTIGKAWEAGADTFVAGQAVFGAADPGQEVRELRRRCLVEV